MSKHSHCHVIWSAAADRVSADMIIVQSGVNDQRLLLAQATRSRMTLVELALQVTME